MKNRGFTLFELLITMAIIGILAAVIGGSFGDAQKKGRDSRRISDMDGLQKAAEMFYSFDNSYPKTTSGAWTTVIGGRIVLEAFPVDPKNVAPYVYGCTKVGGGALDGSSYCCCATMEGTNKGNSAAACAFGGTTHYCVKNQQ
jgi:prepilin-type N-terminal cleavage/methylation domain-containing protein